MQGPKVLMIVGDFVEDYEVMVPFQALQMIGCTVHAVCPDKKAGDTVKTAVHDFEGDQTYTEKPGHNFALNATFAEVRPDDYDGLVIPVGGRPSTSASTRPCWRSSATSATPGSRSPPCVTLPQPLAAAGVLEGRQCSAYPAVRRRSRRAAGSSSRRTGPKPMSTATSSPRRPGRRIRHGWLRSSSVLGLGSSTGRPSVRVDSGLPRSGMTVVRRRSKRPCGRSRHDHPPS